MDAPSLTLPPTSPPRAEASGLGGALAQAADLVLPRSCAGCGVWGQGLCARCRSLLEGPLAEVPHADGAGGLPVWAVAWYQGAVRQMVLGWKNGAREDLGALMQEVGERAGADWAVSLGAAERSRLGTSLGLLVVPAPSGPLRRLRGRLVAARWADAVALGCAQVLTDPAAPGVGVGVASADVLRRHLWGQVGHQAGRSARARRANRRRPARVLANLAGWCVLLVDDVVTTGATLGSCVQAVEAAGATCLGALTLAAARAPQRQEAAGALSGAGEVSAVNERA